MTSDDDDKTHSLQDEKLRRVEALYARADKLVAQWGMRMKTPPARDHGSGGLLGSMSPDKPECPDESVEPIIRSKDSGKGP